MRQKACSEYKRGREDEGVREGEKVLCLGLAPVRRRGLIVVLDTPTRAHHLADLADLAW